MISTPPPVSKVFTPSAYQQAIFDFVTNGTGDGLVEAVAGSGKCLGRDTPILLFDGSIVPVQDIQVGNLLMGPDSQPRQVLSTCTGIGPLYEITPIKGDSWVCNDVHVLTLAGTNRFKGQVRDVALNEYLAETRPSPEGRIDRQWKLMRIGVEFPEQPVPLDPYLVGIWLGDGAKAEPSITNATPQIREYCQAIASQYGCELVVRDVPEHNTTYLRFRVGTRGNAHSGTPHYIHRQLQKLVIADEKRITQEYLCNSRQIRLQLLAGLLDTDGYDAGGYFEIATKYTGLKDDILFLARSLGFATYAVSKVSSIKSLNFTRNYWRITIAGCLDEIPCIVRQMPPRQQIKDVLVTGWDAQPMGNGEYFGFTITGDGRFLLGDFTVTHNTTTLIQAARILNTKKSLFIAFNKHIVEELSGRLVGTKMVAKTIHSIGNGCLMKVFAGKVRIDGNKYRPICQAMAASFGNKMTQFGPQDQLKAATALLQLTRFVRLTLTDPHDMIALDAMIAHHDIDLDPKFDQLAKTAITPILEEGDRLARDEHIIDFDDMVYLPYTWHLVPSQMDWVFCDEAQDLNAAQLDLVLKCRKPGTGRMLFVGDRRQSLYGFMGSDNVSFDKIAGRTGATLLPLSICYRCPSSHVELARAIVATIEARDDAPVGTIAEVQAIDLPRVVRVGDLILCRLNAPLIATCIQLIKARVPAKVRGRDIGKQLGDIVRAVPLLPNYHGFADFIEGLDAYEHEHLSILMRRQDSEAAQQSLCDRCEAVRVCAESFDALSVEDLCQKIEALFSDENTPVILSTVHKAKGLEEERVFLLLPEKMPLVWIKQQDWQLEQEMNIRYVALTRAKDTLFFVR